MLAREHIPTSDGSVLVDAWRPFSQSQFLGILNQIRNHLLDFLLELQQINPDVLESEDALRAVSGEKVQNVIQTIVYGNDNTVATGTDFTQTVTRKVVAGDTRSLIDHLGSIGLDKDSLDELETAIEQDGDRQQEATRQECKVVDREDGCQGDGWNLEGRSCHSSKPSESRTVPILRGD